MKKIKLLGIITVLSGVLFAMAGCGQGDDNRAFEATSAPAIEAEMPEIATDSDSNALWRQQQGQTINQIRSGMLTAGEWNDNENHDFILNLMQTDADFHRFERMWHFNLSNQIKAIVTDNGSPVNNARVELLDANENVIFSARTNNHGIAHLFAGLGSQGQSTADFIRASSATTQMSAFDLSTRTYEFNLLSEQAPQSLDLMFVIDTTGSMGDELEYLKVELADIVRQVNHIHANIDIRLSIIAYRDYGDEYLTRESPFTRDINSQITFLEAQFAHGGGDWEEAVEAALDAALSEDWNNASSARLMFLVLDAPPRNTDENRAEMHRLTLLSADMGVRIIPVASSGIDTVTEYLLRALAMATGGTYVFLTGDSGIGHGHIDPTIGDHEIELLNDVLVRVISSYLK